ncbi:MAG: iron-containing alcohol dehydrogenase [Chloroflexota bacterium]
MPRFYLPTEIITGNGCLGELGRAAARYGQRAMLVCGQGFARRGGLLDRATGLLAGQGLAVTIYDQVRGEADLDTVAQGLELARAQGCQVFIGLGGGSAIDTAKAIAGLLALPGAPAEYHAGRAVDGPAQPWIAVPTTAGTGAEVTKNAVLIDPATAVKQSIRDDAWFARVALVDPELTLSMPPEVTASTGSDALCQAIEAYTSIGASPLTDALAMQAIALIGESLVRAYEHGDDLAARAAMSTGSLLAGMAMASARLGGVHGMAHPLGSHFGIPHGLVCGLLLPYTVAKYATVARLLGMEAATAPDEELARRCVERVRALLRQVAIPEHLGPFGVRADNLEGIIAESLPAGSLKANPRPLAAEDVRAILLAAL